MWLAFQESPINAAHVPAAPHAVRRAGPRGAVAVLLVEGLHVAPEGGPEIVERLLGCVRGEIGLVGVIPRLERLDVVGAQLRPGLEGVGVTGEPGHAGAGAPHAGAAPGAGAVPQAA